jgi:hypothetical protein
LTDQGAPLKPGDLTTLSAFELGALLNKIDTALGPMVQEANEVEKAATEASVKLIYYPDDREAKVALKIANGRLNVIKRNMRHLDKRQLRIQSILKSRNL